MPLTRMPPPARNANQASPVPRPAPTGNSRLGRVLVFATAVGVVLSLVTLVTRATTSHRARSARVDDATTTSEDERAESTSATRPTSFDRAARFPRWTNEPAPGEAAAPTAAAAEPPRTPPDKQRIAYATNVYERQTYDRTWADGARRGIEERLRTLTDPAARPGRIDCRSTLCRLDISVSGGVENAESYLHRTIRGGIWQGEAMYTRTPPDAQGNVTLTMLMAKPGEALPEETLTGDAP